MDDIAVAKKAGKGLGSIVKGTGHLIDGAKGLVEKLTDPMVDLAAVNLGGFWAANEALNSTDLSEPSNMALGAAYGLAAYAGNKWLVSKNKEGNRRISSFNDMINKNRYLSWSKLLSAAALSGFMLVGNPQKADDGLKPTFRIMYDDFKNTLNLPDAPMPDNFFSPDVEVKPDRRSNLRTPLEEVVDLGYQSKVEHDFTGVQLDNKYSLDGRVQRTLRWQPIYHAVEQKYGLSKGIIGAIIMKESCGDPMQPNAGNDGGAGLGHQQGPWAKAMGLDIHGNSSSYTDREHGKNLKEMIEECNYDPVCAQEKDDRFHPIINLDAVGRFIAQSQNDDEGVMKYRGGRRNTRENYLRDVRMFQERLNDLGVIEAAEKDFNKRNERFSFREYIKQFHEMNDNWGLEEYARL